MSEWNFIIAAYTITWVVIIGYALHLRRAMRRARTLYEAAKGEAESTGRTAP